jgi:hypothetical protein
MSVLYAPLMLSLRRDAVQPELWRWTMRLYVYFALFIAVAGIAQFFAQFVFQPVWLFDYRGMIPEALRASGGWNTVYTVTGWTKSNGFFLREPSLFSIAMAFALLCELSLWRRKWVMAVLAFALVLSYSGSGLLGLAVAMLFPLGRGMVLRLLVCAVLAALAIVLLGDTLNLSYTLNRVGEINSERSSAYCRFVYPGAATILQLNSEPWTMLLGHGPGSMERMGATCEDLHSTAYAKLLFEYGVLGVLALGVLMLGVLNRSGAPIRIRVAAGLTWLLLGGLFNSDVMLFIYFLSAIWPEGIAAQAVKTDPSREREAAA